MSSSLSWDAIPETTAVTSNPAAGTISVDVKTFTGRGHVSYISCQCLADANVATRQLLVQKISGALTVTMAASPTFTATATGTLVSGTGFTSAFSIVYGCMLNTDFGPGDILRVVVSGGQAGDDLSAITYNFKEMR